MNVSHSHVDVGIFQSVCSGVRKQFPGGAHSTFIAVGKTHLLDTSLGVSSEQKPPRKIIWRGGEAVFFVCVPKALLPIQGL